VQITFKIADFHRSELYQRSFAFGRTHPCVVSSAVPGLYYYYHYYY